MRKAEEGLGTSNGAEAYPADISLTVDEHLASSPSAPCEYQDSASDELSAGGPGTPTQLTTTTDVSGSNTTTSRPAAPSSVTATNDAAKKPKREEPRDNDDDDNNLVKLEKIFMSLFFQAAIALMIYRVQLQTQQGDSSTNLPSLSSIQFKTVWATTLFGFAFTLSGMMLREQHRKVANICCYASVFLGALDFFLMLSILADESLDWIVWAVVGALLMVFAYTLRRKMGI